jgi:hypothetical protein
VVDCGAAGVHLVEIGKEVKRLSVLETDGFATDVAVDGDRVLVAAGFGGLSVCQVEGDSLVRVGRYREPGASIRQVEVAGNFAFIVDGGTRVRMLDLSDAKAPRLVMTDNQSGLLYGDQLMRGTMEEGRYAAAFWHVSGLHWYDLEAKAGPVHSGDNWAARFGSPNGLFSLGDEVLVTTRGGYMLVNRGERRALGEVPLYRVGEKPLHLGKPTVFKDHLYCADRASGLVTVADVSDLRKPEMVEQFVLQGNPGRIAVNEEWVAIPAGVGGLLVLER